LIADPPVHHAPLGAPHGGSPTTEHGSTLSRSTVTPLRQFSNNGQRLTRVSASELARQHEGLQQLQTLSRQRSQVERSNAVGTRAGGASHSRAGTPASLKLPIQSNGTGSRTGGGAPTSGFAGASDGGAGSLRRSAVEPSRFGTSAGSQAPWQEHSGDRPWTNRGDFRSQPQLSARPFSSAPPARDRSFARSGPMQPGGAGRFSPSWGRHSGMSSFSSPRFGQRPALGGWHGGGGMHFPGGGRGSGGHGSSGRHR
jgi:hypothetical protein